MKYLLLFFIAMNLSFMTVKDEIPSKIDLSRYCPSNRHQYRATCYAYAFAYTALSINYCVKNNITNSIDVEANAFSHGFISSIHRKQSVFNPKCGRNGSYDVDLEIFKKYGCPKLQDFDVNCTSKIPKKVLDLAKSTQLDEFKYIQNENDNSISAILKIKEVLGRNIPVLIVLNMTNDFASLGRDCNERLPVLIHGKKSSVAHDICIIGYDDDPASKYNGRFLIKNNYSDWGDSRNMAWVKYEDMMYMITHALYFTIK